MYLKNNIPHAGDFHVIKKANTTQHFTVRKRNSSIWCTHCNKTSATLDKDSNLLLKHAPNLPKSHTLQVARGVDATQFWTPLCNRAEQNTRQVNPRNAVPWSKPPSFDWTLLIRSETPHLKKIWSHQEPSQQWNYKSSNSRTVFWNCQRSIMA